MAKYSLFFIGLFEIKLAVIAKRSIYYRDGQVKHT
jgi:hypothetical protein